MDSKVALIALGHGFTRPMDMPSLGGGCGSSFCVVLEIASVALGMALAMSRKEHSSHRFTQPVDMPSLGMGMCVGVVFVWFWRSLRSLWAWLSR